MTNNNKILTVSYGTFSCTLEGFEDSFDTMKAIAEYFRDLAADDRYFGAEPPQPDADMLARIAEKEVSRRVEAHEHEGGILLKAQQHSPPAPAADSDKSEQNTDAQGKGGAEEIENTDAPDDNEDATAEFDEHRVADDLHSQADTSPKTVRENETPSPAPRIEDIEAFFAADETELSVEDARELIDTGEKTFDQKQVTESSSSVFSDEAEMAAPTHVAAEESFAEKLKRIRAVVSTQDVDAFDTDYDEDVEAPMPLGPFRRLDGDEARIVATKTNTAAVAQAADDISAALAQDDAVRKVHADMPDAGGNDIESILNRLEHGNALTDDLTEEDEFGDASDENLFEAIEDAHREAKALYGDEPATSDVQEAFVAPGKTQAWHGQHVADAVDKDSPLVLGSDGTSDGSAQPASSDADLAEHDATDAAARNTLPDIGGEVSADFSRLMAEADYQLQEPEGKTRRSAFAHLRAAVAARFADRTMHDKDQHDAAEEAEAYRSDLAEVVRPRGPMAAEADAERRADARPAPLTLVAEQRVDTSRLVKRGPVSPRRIAATEEEDISKDEDSGFAEYAGEKGAESLTELLEAAAAYLSYVEGHDQFSRPQLMTRVRQADCGEFSREDGLRSFGQLLRTGKIEKIKGGRFAASEGIGYKPGHRAVG